MPTSDPTPSSPSPELVLAAVDRAERHSRKPNQLGVPKSPIAAHLGLPHSSWTTRRVRPILERLETDGLIEQLRRHGVTLWTPTSNGRRRLSALQRAGTIALPESPQHRAWREARAAAEARHEEFRAGLRHELAQASTLLDGTSSRRSSNTRASGWDRPRTACSNGPSQTIHRRTAPILRWLRGDIQQSGGSPYPSTFQWSSVRDVAGRPHAPTCVRARLPLHRQMALPSSPPT